MTKQRDDDDDLLAAEYVLGVLSLAERGAFEARLKAEPALAVPVARWQSRLVPMTDQVTHVAPSENLFPRIEARLFPQPARNPWFSGFWGWAGGAMVAVLVAGYLLTASPLALGPDPVLTAELLANESQVSYSVKVSADQINLTLTGPAPNSDQSYELWLIEGDNPPVSLGLIGSGPLPLVRPLSPGMILAVSLEPLGGSPTGQATGPVIALGPLQAI